MESGNASSPLQKYSTGTFLPGRTVGVGTFRVYLFQGICSIACALKCAPWPQGFIVILNWKKFMTVFDTIKVAKIIRSQQSVPEAYLRLCQTSVMVLFKFRYLFSQNSHKSYIIDISYRVLITEAATGGAL